MSVIVPGTEYLGKQITVEIVRHCKSPQLIIVFCCIVHTRMI